MKFNIADLFESLADAIGDREALVCGDHRSTFRELDERASRLAHYLADRGVRAGDHVGLYLFNCAEFIEAMLAAFKIRAVPVNINYRYVADELRYMLRKRRSGRSGPPSRVCAESSATWSPASRRCDNLDLRRRRQRRRCGRDR